MRLQADQEQALLRRHPQHVVGIRGAALLLVAALLSGCFGSDDGGSWFSSDQGPVCPAVATVSHATDVVVFDGAPSADMKTVQYGALLRALDHSCAIVDDKVQVDLKLTFAVELGPAATSQEIELPFFVALSRRGSSEVLNKWTHTVRHDLGRRKTESVRAEVSETFAPVAGTESGDYQLFVGLQLTPEQLDFNRRRDGAAPPS